MDSSFPRSDVVQLKNSDRSNAQEESSQKRPSEPGSITGSPEKRRKMNECESSLIPDQGEGESSSADVGPCYFHLLPNEVLEMIFSYIPSLRDRKRIRKVCKLWCEVSNICQKPDEVYIRDVRKIWKRSASFKHIENCGFKYLNLCFKSRDMEIFPVTMWEKIGTKVISLELKGCTLGDQIMENIILFCPNLQSLRIIIPFGLRVERMTLCSIEMLKKLSVVRNTLRTFEIGVSRHTTRPGSHFPLIPHLNYETWNELFQTFFQIFPNVVHFSWAKYYKNGDKFDDVFKCEFTKDGPSTSDNAVVATVMAYALSARSWTAAFSKLDTLRLSSISLSAMDCLYRHQDEDWLLNSFQDPRKLKSIEIDLSDQFPYYFIQTLFFQILKNCDELEELKYFKDTFWLHGLTSSQETELSQLLALSPKLEKVVMSNFVLELKPQSLSSLPFFDKFKVYPIAENSDTLNFRKTLKIFFKLYPGLQHLTLEVTDEILHYVFKFFVNLKTLKLTLHSRVTKFGLTGRSGGHPIGFGIDRLQYLEKLEIYGYGFETSNGRIDEYLQEIHLPNLKHLTFALPNKFHNFVAIGCYLPLLEEVCLKRLEKIPIESLLYLCRRSKNLQVLRLDGFMLSSQVDISIREVKKMMSLCPTLKYIYRSKKMYHYNDVTGKVVCRYQK